MRSRTPHTCRLRRARGKGARVAGATRMHSATAREAAAEEVEVVEGAVDVTDQAGLNPEYTVIPEDQRPPIYDAQPKRQQHSHHLPPHHLTTSPPHHLTTSPPHH